MAITEVQETLQLALPLSRPSRFESTIVRVSPQTTVQPSSRKPWTTSCKSTTSTTSADVHITLRPRAKSSGDTARRRRLASSPASSFHGRLSKLWLTLSSTPTPSAITDLWITQPRPISIPEDKWRCSLNATRLNSRPYCSGADKICASTSML